MTFLTRPPGSAICVVPILTNGVGTGPAGVGTLQTSGLALACAPPLFSMYIFCSLFHSSHLHSLPSAKLNMFGVNAGTLTSAKICVACTYTPVVLHYDTL